MQKKSLGDLEIESSQITAFLKNCMYEMVVQEIEIFFPLIYNKANICY